MRESLEDFLNRCLAQLIAENEGWEDCLSDHPELVLELEPLLRLAKEIRTLPRPEPHPRALIATQARIREAAVLKRKRKAIPRWLPDRKAFRALARALAIVAVALLISFGSVVASADSLPHSPLYPVKRTVERVHLLLTFNPSGRAELHLSFAERRLNEAMRLAKTHKRVEEGILIAMFNETNLAIEIICSLPEAEMQPLLTKAAHLTAYQCACLEQMKSEIPIEMGDDLNNAIATCRCYDQMMRQERPCVHSPTRFPIEKPGRETR